MIVDRHGLCMVLGLLLFGCRGPEATPGDTGESQGLTQAVDCAGYPQWNALTIYDAGRRVVYQNKLYEALVPIWCADPVLGTASGWYRLVGSCGGGGDNTPPTVSLTSPADGATFNAGASVTVSADAQDSDGCVRQVEFFHGPVSLGVATSAPYSMVWNSVSAGSYTLTAVATDDRGATATSKAVTIVVNNGSGGSCSGIPQYMAGTSYSAGQQVQNGGEIYRCDIAGWCSSAGAWAYAPGTGQYWATAWTHVGPCGGGGSPPTVSITAPLDGASFDPGNIIEISATASDSDGTVTRVEFFDGVSKLGEDNTAPYSYRWSGAPSGAHRLTATAWDNANNSTTSAIVTITVTGDDGGGGGFPAHVFVPYVDMLWPDVDAFGLAQHADTVSKFFTLAFIIDGGSCEGRWGGIIPLSQDSAIQTDIAALRAKGGDVIVSFGGAMGIELGESCASEDALLTQYQAVVSRYNLKRVDFDIEGASVAQPSRSRRHRALARLRAQNPGLVIQYTLPVLPSGLSYDGISFLEDANANGFVPDIVNIMAMDYYQGSQDMSQAAKRAIDSTIAQLQTIFFGKSAAQYRAMIGVTPMIGVNDDRSVFEVADAPEIRDYATSLGISLIAMWSANRDHPCGASEGELFKCSHVSQSEFDFSRAFQPFTR